MQDYYLTRYFLTVAFGLSSLILFSKDMVINPITIPSSKEFVGRVNSIYQDRIGYIWFGKESGLYRYDGNEIKAYRFNPFDSLSISSNSVSTIVEDSLGDLWVGTIGGGLNHFRRKDGTFTRYLHNPKNQNSISFNEVTSIRPDGNGNLLIGTDGGGLNVFNLKLKQFKSFKVDSFNTKGLFSNKILDIYPAYKGGYWLATWNGGLHFYNPEGNKFRHFGNGTKYSKCNMYYVKEVKPGTLWISTDDVGLISYDVKRNLFSTVIPRSIIPYFWDIHVTSKGEVLVSSCVGLLYFQSPTLPYKVVECDAPNIVSVYKTMIDRTQTIWVGGTTGYVGKINSVKKSFHSLTGKLPNGELPVFSINTNKSPGPIFFSSKSFMVEFNRITNSIRLHKTDVTDINSLASIPGSDLLLCTGDIHVSIFDTKTSRITPLKLNDTVNDLAKVPVRSMSVAGASCYWINSNGVSFRVKVDPKTRLGHLQKVFYPSRKEDVPEPHYASVFLNGQNGSLWAGTWGGGLIHLSNNGDSQFAYFMHDATNKTSISDNYIECMAADSRGNIFIGTKLGLNRFNPQTKSFSRLLSTDGLADDWIKAIAIDSKNRIWVSSRGGISVVSDNFRDIKNYDLNDILPSTDFYSRSVATDLDGNIYFGSAQGLVWFNPDSINNNPYLPEAVVTGLEINHKNVGNEDKSPLKQSIEFTQKIRLQHKPSSISFHLAALSYFNPEKNKIKYKLEGYDSDWQMAGHNRTATYSGISYGKYTFSVMAANEDGVWNTNAKNIEIEMVRPLWLSIGAIFFYFVISTMGILFILKKRHKPAVVSSQKTEAYTAKKVHNHILFEPTYMQSTPADLQFLQKVLAIVEGNMANPDFGVSDLSSKICLSQRQLCRKMNTITGVNISEFIREVRLKRAAQLLLQKPVSISDVAYQVGFFDPKYFSKCFKQQFGVSPNQYSGSKEAMHQTV